VHYCAAVTAGGLLFSVTCVAVHVCNDVTMFVAVATQWETVAVIVMKLAVQASSGIPFTRWQHLA